MATPDASRFRILPVVAIAALGAGAATLAYGLERLPWPESLPWSRVGLVSFLLLLTGLALAIFAVARLARLGALGATAIVVASLMVLLGAAMPLLVVVAFGLASTLVGARLRGLWHDNDPENGDPLVDLLAGLGSYGTLISVLAHVPVNHPALYALLLAAPIAFDRHAALARCREFVRAVRAEPRPPAVAWVAGTLGATYAVVALFPDVGFDSLAMHLFIPGHLATHRSWNFDVSRYSFAVMPALVDWIYSLAYLLEGERAARLLNAAFVQVAAALVFRLASLAGASRGWAWLAAALFLATPVTFMIGSTLFVDAAWTAFLLGAVLLLMRPGVTGQPPRGWITAAVLAGFAAAAKAVTLPMLPALLLLVAFEHRALRPRGSGRVLVLAIAAFAIASCKPYLTAWLLTGNPVYPFFVNVFGSTTFNLWLTGPEHFRAPLTWTTPYELTFESARFVEGRAGAAGFQWLLLVPVALVALVAGGRRRGLLLLLVGVAMTALVFHFMAYLRYIAPALAIITAAIAAGGSALKDSSPWIARVMAVAGTAAIALDVAFLNAAGLYPSFPIDALASPARRRAFLELEAPMRAATEFAARLPAGGGKLAFFGTPTFGAAPGVEALYPGWYNQEFWRAMRSADSPDALAQRLIEWKIRYVLVQAGFGHPRLRQLVDGATRPIAEFRGVSVRELHPDRLFRTELLSEGEFASLEGWTLTTGAKLDSSTHALVVTAQSPAYQLVPVKPGSVYRNSVKARCGGGAEVRAQVNWLDAAYRPIGATLRPFACHADWGVYEQEVVAPRKAHFAVVYATGETSAPVTIGAVSFRGAFFD